MNFRGGYVLSFIINKNAFYYYSAQACKRIVAKSTLNFVGICVMLKISKISIIHNMYIYMQTFILCRNLVFFLWGYFCDDNLCERCHVGMNMYRREMRSTNIVSVENAPNSGKREEIFYDI